MSVIPHCQSQLQIALFAAGCSLFPLSLSLAPVAVASPTAVEIAQNAPEKSERTQIFVNPNTGNDVKGDGTERSPFQTITHALKVAEADTAIQLTPGTYSTETGEVFPIKLKPGVTLLGNPSTKGQNIIIQGGGRFLSPTFASQDVALVGANSAALAGVTVTNTNPRGYGLWIESTSPVVADSTFTNNTHDGISVNGNAAPVIRSNSFTQNGANGITVFGTSRPEIIDNVFENTGFGINIAQKAAPLIIGNQILRNKDGIVVQASALPILRNNTIEGNSRFGLVAIAQSQPNLGISTQAGGNVFRNNGELDINAKASSQVIPAFGNQLIKTRTIGQIDLEGVAPLVAAAPQIEVKSPILEARRTTTASTATSAASFPVPTSLDRPAAASPPPVASNRRLTAPPQPRQVTGTTAAINIPVPPAANSATLAVAPNRGAIAQNAAIEIPVPPPASNSVVPTSSPNSSPSVSAQVPVLGPLPVPNGNVPLGNAGNIGTVRIQANPRAGDPPAPPSRGEALGLSYRVIVNATTASEQAKVRSLVPGAFRTSVNGRVVMQAGAFNNIQKAEELLQTLTSKGLNARVEEY